MWAWVWCDVTDNGLRLSYYICTLILPAALGKGDWLYCIGWKIFFVVPHDVPLQTWLPSLRHPWYYNPSFLVPQPLILVLQLPPGAPTSHPWYSNLRTRQCWRPCRRARCLEDPASPLWGRSQAAALFIIRITGIPNKNWLQSGLF